MIKNYLMGAGMMFLTSASFAQNVAERANLQVQQQNLINRSAKEIKAVHRAPGDFLACDDFSTPENWSTYTLDGTEPQWEIVTDEPEVLDGYISDMASTTEENGFGMFNGRQYLVAGDVPPQNAVIEFGSTIDCSEAAGVSIQFEQTYRAFNSDRTFVEVTAGDWDTDPVYSVEINTDIVTNATSEHKLIELSVSEIAAGQPNVRVRFRWEELAADDVYGAGYAWFIDDFCVKESWENDQALTTAYHRSGKGIWMVDGMGYYNIPTSQVTEIFFFGGTENMGSSDQTEAKLNVSVDGAVSFSGTSEPIALEASDTDTFEVSTAFIPALETGVYDFTYFLDSENPEQATENDTLFDEIRITDWVYSRDNGFSSSSIQNVGGNTNLPLTIGNVFDIFGDTELGAIDIAVTSSDNNIGKIIYGQVMVFDPGSSTFVYAGQTQDHEITAGENGGFIRLILDEDDHVSLTEGQTILVLAGHYGGPNEVAFRMAQLVELGTVLGYRSGESEPFNLLDPSAIMVRPVLNSFVGVEEVEIQNFTVGQNQPNPFGDNAVINYELNESANVMIEFTDLSGKVVKTINNGQQQAGAHTLYIDGNDFAEGVYFYTFTVGAEKITKRMVIAK